MALFRIFFCCLKKNLRLDVDHDCSCVDTLNCDTNGLLITSNISLIILVVVDFMFHEKVHDELIRKINT